MLHKNSADQFASQLLSFLNSSVFRPLLRGKSVSSLSPTY